MFCMSARYMKFKNRCLTTHEIHAYFFPYKINHNIRKLLDVSFYNLAYFLTRDCPFKEVLIDRSSSINGYFKPGDYAIHLFIAILYFAFLCVLHDY